MLQSSVVSAPALSLDEVVEGIIYGAQDMGIAMGSEDSYHALLEIVAALETMYGFKRYVVTGLPMVQFSQFGLVDQKAAN